MAGADLFVALTRLVGPSDPIYIVYSRSHSWSNRGDIDGGINYVLSNDFEAVVEFVSD